MLRLPAAAVGCKQLPIAAQLCRFIADSSKNSYLQKAILTHKSEVYFAADQKEISTRKCLPGAALAVDE